MWKHEFTEYTSIHPDELWKPLSDVANWGRIDQQIESIEIDGTPIEGKVFFLKPKGGPRLKLRIESLVPPNQYADVCILPLARMKTTHSLVRVQDQTKITVCIEITGPLTFVWKHVVGRQHANGLVEQTKRLIEFVQSRGEMT